MTPLSKVLGRVAAVINAFHQGGLSRTRFAVDPAYKFLVVPIKMVVDEVDIIGLKATVKCSG